MSRARDLADVAGGQTVANATPSGGLVLIEKKTVAQGSASTTAFDFTNCFSSSYDIYQVEFDIIRNGDSAARHIFASFSNANTRLTNNVVGMSSFNQAGATTDGKSYHTSTDGVHQFGGTIAATGSGTFTGTARIHNTQSTTLANQITGNLVMNQYLSTDVDGIWQEDFLSVDEFGDLSGTSTDILFGIIQGDSLGTDVSFSATQAAAFGTISIFGVKGV
tara:strand:- start:4639 stop:5298 length:660 start_codon:yes stop_codon:yes gene_type:complete